MEMPLTNVSDPTIIKLIYMNHIGGVSMDSYVFANAVFSRFSRNYMALKKNLPIRPSEMAVLNILAAFPALHTPVMLAERLGVSKPMITALLTALWKKGYITKEPSQEDKRAYFVLLTPKAEELVETARAESNGHLEDLLAALGQEDFDTLVKLAQKANLVLEAENEEET